MDQYIWIVFGVLGGVVGLFLPQIAEKMALQKMRKKDLELESKPFYRSAQLKVYSLIWSGIGWAACAYIYELSLVLLCSLLIWSIGIVVVIVDVRIHIISNEAVLLLAALGVVIQLKLFGVKALLMSILLTIIVMIVLISVGNMVGLWKVGAGDVKLIGSMVLILGRSYIVYGIIIMAASMGVFSLGGMMMKKLNRYSMIPFAPFIVSGIMAGILAMLFLI